MFKEKIEHAVGLDGVDETHFIFTTVYRIYIYDFKLIHVRILRDT